MIVITGGAGFIGSALIWGLNKKGEENILVVDALKDDERWKNLCGLKFRDYLEKDEFLYLLTSGKLKKPDTIIHMGACSDTTERDGRFMMLNNFEYSKRLAEYAWENKIRFIYASSGATYGDGSKGFSDDEEKLEELRPLNLYGYSKHLFDLWAKRKGYLASFVGLKYFNVYGPNEYHKKEMRSFVCKAYEQIKTHGKVRLFKSYKSEYRDGEQKRDFIYIKDAVDVTLFFHERRELSGIYNVGTGTPRTWNDLVNAVFNALEVYPVIEYIDMPEELRDQYQYYTCADVEKLRRVGYEKEFTSLEDGVRDYVLNYLEKGKRLQDHD
ncbi:ADP-glyceromanno-heptose 6-epimerase [bacterium]|nr:MAG: ADP-glyceromanno-heptose 6-epimerase [bacterium]RKZ24746.1 MAG: ADP-glyceromanno-heptose 6-epimerase [bacterium]